MHNFIQKYNANLFTLLLLSGPRKCLARCPGNKVNSHTSCVVKRSRMYGKPNPFVQTDRLFALAKPDAENCNIILTHAYRLTVASFFFLFCFCCPLGRHLMGAYPGFTIGGFLAVVCEIFSDHAHFSAPPTN